MLKRRAVLSRIIFFLLCPALTWAHPVSYQGALSVMTWNQPYLNDFWTTYSVKPYAAVAARYMRMVQKDGVEMDVYGPQADFLFYRKNAKNYQANLYGYGGYGAETQNARTGSAGLLGLEADAESRTWYVAGSFNATLPSIGENIYSTTVRGGVAAYPAEFDELGTWFIVAVQENPQLEQRTDVTPYVRLMYRNMLAELGAGFSGKWMMNFMVHF